MRKESKMHEKKESKSMEKREHKMGKGVSQGSTSGIVEKRRKNNKLEGY